MIRRVRPALLPLAVLALTLSSCRRQPEPAAAHPHYLVGSAWQGEGGAWFYPREQTDGSFTGIATTLAAPSGPDGLAADGTRPDPAAPGAAVQSLQLPVVLRVTDLLNGRQLVLRADDRGPASPARAIALDAAAERLLGIAPGTATPVRVEIDSARSQSLAQSLPGGPHLDIATAPAGVVRRQSLGPPGAPEPVGAASQSTAAPTAPDGANSAAPDLPATVTTVAVSPVAYAIDAGTFSNAAVAAEIAARISGRVATEGGGRAATYAVRIGPLADVAAADAALDRARGAGISGARIIVDQESPW